MIKRVRFGGRALPYWLLLPQLFISLVFFFGPAGYALLQSFLLSDPFGQHSKFVWLANFAALFRSPEYHTSILLTLLFSACAMALALALGLAFAVAANRIVRGAGLYKTFLILPYAAAPPLAGVLWLFLFHPSYGVVAYWLNGLGIAWNPLLSGDQAMLLVILAAAWKQISYNFVFFLAGLQGIPKSLLEAAAVDGAGPARRFWAIVFPLLSPIGFFLVVVNLVYAF
ncbi:MAG TPA: ABC transporter permease subunit, partial [bacterium]|nr:ABC transporter permease subunit [bacterium]